MSKKPNISKRKILKEELEQVIGGSPNSYNPDLARDEVFEETYTKPYYTRKKNISLSEKP